MLASYNYQVVVYMDDLLFVSYEEDSVTSKLIALIAYCFDMFGLTISSKKSVLFPS